MNLERELAVARRAASQAAQIVMGVYSQEFSVDWKGVDDPVTVADRSANDAIVAILRAEFGGDAICSEEADMAVSAAQARQGGRCWFVDPLDGTREFVSKNGEFSVMIGLAIDGVPVLGCVLAPVWKKEFFAVVGEGDGAGAYVVELEPGATPRRLVARDVSGERPLRIAVSRSHQDATAGALVHALGATPYECGSVGLKVALVLLNETDLYAHTGKGAKLWDGCAPHAIAIAAGLEFTDSFGEPIRYNTNVLPLSQGILVCEKTLHSRALSALSVLRARK